MQKKVAITGMGIVSAIGMTVEENFHALMSKKTGISRLELFESKHASSIKVGEIKKSNDELIQLLGLDSTNTFTRTALLGALAAKQAFDQAQLKPNDVLNVGLISSTSVGGMDFTEKHYKKYNEHLEYIPFISSHHAGDSTNKIADYLGIKGFVTTISTACSSAANAIMLGAQMIENGYLDRVIVGGTDALSKFTINGFKTLMILSDTDNTPFDQNRKGLNLGEAAAFLVLESDECVQKQNKKVLGYVVGYGNANDAYHQTASSENGEGAFLAMKKAFEKAEISSNQIDYINVHGTATPNNDLSEGRALLRMFDSVPKFSSTKAFTGHTLAAAAAIEAVYSLLALQHQVVFPNLNFSTPMEEFNLIPETEVHSHPIDYVLSNSFGFGGNCSTLIFSKS